MPLLEPESGAQGAKGSLTHRQGRDRSAPASLRDSPSPAAEEGGSILSGLVPAFPAGVELEAQCGEAGGEGRVNFQCLPSPTLSTEVTLPLRSF